MASELISFGAAATSLVGSIAAGSTLATAAAAAEIDKAATRVVKVFIFELPLVLPPQEIVERSLKFAHILINARRGRDHD
jgi:hypothetical protein